MVSKIRKNIEANDMSSLPIVPTQVTLRGNVGSLDAPTTSQLFTFGPSGQGNALRVSRIVSKISKKIGEANGMLNLPIVPTQVSLRGNVGSWDAPIEEQLFTFGPRGQGKALRGS